MRIRQDDEQPRIVVGVDGFESSGAALRWAIHQAKLTGAVVEAGDRLARPGRRRLVGFRNSATDPDLGFYAARLYSLMRPPRRGWRWIRLRERSATGCRVPKYGPVL
jgi:hypothetical protein